MSSAACEALAAGAGSSAGNSLIDGSGAPPAVTGLKAGASSVTGLRAGASLVPLGDVGGSSLDQKTAFGLGAWAESTALALSESSASAAGLQLPRGAPSGSLRVVEACDLSRTR